MKKIEKSFYSLNSVRRKRKLMKPETIAFLYKQKILSNLASRPPFEGPGGLKTHRYETYTLTLTRRQ
ncbi:hypothetical protein BpHYR1_000009, partial [Brachionus plicatilis]